MNDIYNENIILEKLCFKNRKINYYKIKIKLKYLIKFIKKYMIIIKVHSKLFFKNVKIYLYIIK